MTDLRTLLVRGAAYLRECERIARLRPAETWQDESDKALRRHSDLMRDLSLADAQALLAAVTGAAKWAERRAADGSHLGDALIRLEDAAASLLLHCAEEEDARAGSRRALARAWDDAA